MQGIIFIGIQGSGKSTFYKEQFFNSHVRIGLDLLNTRNKEQQLLSKCLELQQRVVIDNTNPTKVERNKYIQQFQANKYKVIGYYFKSNLKESLKRNAQRSGKARIPDVGVISTYKKLELPTFNEGFDELFYVEIVNETFVIKEWKNEI